MTEETPSTPEITHTEKEFAMPETRTIGPAAREHDRHRLEGTPDNLRCLCTESGSHRFVDEWEWHEHVVAAVLAVSVRWKDRAGRDRDLDSTGGHHA